MVAWADAAGAVDAGAVTTGDRECTLQPLPRHQLMKARMLGQWLPPALGDAAMVQGLQVACQPGMEEHYEFVMN